MRHRKSVICSVLVTTLVAGCADIPGTGKANKKDIEYDFGIVDISEGVQRLEHTFLIENTQHETMTIVKIVPSCGCVSMRVSKERLQPGETAELTLAMDVGDVGAVRHGATVISVNESGNESRKIYDLLARSTTGISLKIIRGQAIIDKHSEGDYLIRIVYKAEDGFVETEAPLIDVPKDVTVEFLGWYTLEKQTTRKIRPTRQVGTLKLGIKDYKGSFPIKVIVRLSRGLQKRFEIRTDESRDGET